MEQSHLIQTQTFGKSHRIQDHRINSDDYKTVTRIKGFKKAQVK